MHGSKTSPEELIAMAAWRTSPVSGGTIITCPDRPCDAGLGAALQLASTLGA